ncbi:MAG: MEDS domain-containing protein [Syntrophomonas sp.]
MAKVKTSKKTTPKHQTGEHIICLYDDLMELEDASLAFLNEGLDRGEKCICLNCPNKPDSYYQFLVDNVVSQPVKPNQLAFIDATDVYLNKNRLDPLHMIIFLMRKLREASLEGYKSTRYIMDMGWTGFDDWGLLDCEALLNKYLIPYFSCTLLCGYNLERLNPRLLREIAINHPQVMRSDRVVNNRYFAPPRPFLAYSEGKDSLEHLMEIIDRDLKKQSQTPFKAG